ncbi:unnamed protein product, partial [Brenthis ino]
MEFPIHLMFTTILSHRTQKCVRKLLTHLSRRRRRGIKLGRNKKYCSILFDKVNREQALSYVKIRDIIERFVECIKRTNDFAHALVYVERILNDISNSNKIQQQSLNQIIQ